MPRLYAHECSYIFQNHDGRVCFAIPYERDFTLIGTNDDGAVAAYDAKSGAQKWIWKGDGPAYASPVIVEMSGVKQVVTLTQKYAVGLSLASGGTASGALVSDITAPVGLSAGCAVPQRLPSDFVS